jgi:hypothetical protein
MKTSRLLSIIAISFSSPHPLPFFWIYFIGSHHRARNIMGISFLQSSNQVLLPDKPWQKVELGSK